MPTMKETIQKFLIDEYRVGLLPEAPHDLTRYEEVVKILSKFTGLVGYINLELGVGYVHVFERIYE